MNPKTIAGILAYILLLIYAMSIGYILRKVWMCGGGADCKAMEFNTGVIYSVTLVGGLVSALVISKLAATKPGSALTMTSNEEDAETPEKFVAGAYLVIWLAAGLASFLVGEVLFPGSSGTLSDIGKTWIGLAVSATYSYFGVKPGT